MNTFDDPIAQIGHFLAGGIVGLIVTVVVTLIGLPSIFVLWGVAAAVGTWWYLEPDDPDELEAGAS